MKRITSLPLLLAATMLAFASCSKSDPASDVNPGGGAGNGGGKGLPTEKGQPSGEPFRKKIGPAGGTVEYPGARLTLNVPAGAVEQETEFIIQPITNTAPGGKGLAYRLQPEALTFKKPATLTIRYTSEDLQGTIPGALGIATQKADGIWYTVGALRNLATKTISVQTTHFSDWSFFEAISLQPGIAVADPGQQVPLAVKCVLPGQDDLLEPLTPEGKEAALLDPKTLLDPRFIEKWTLQGSGQLAGTGNTGKYTAPAQIPATNPALVSVNIKSKGKAVGILLSRIFVAPEGISVSIAGGGWTTYGNSGGHITPGESFVMANDGNVTASMKWQGARPGQWAWDLTTIVFLLNIGTEQTYAQLYNAGGQAVASHGSLQVLETGSSGPWIIGMADIHTAGHFIYSHPPVTTTTPVKAYFRVKRLN